MKTRILLTVLLLYPIVTALMMAHTTWEPISWGAYLFTCGFTFVAGIPLIMEIGMEEGKK